MRNITETIAHAFMNGYEKRISNSYTDGNAVYLWGNKIIRKHQGKIQINLCGYNTVTTRERINGVLSYTGTGYGVTTKQGKVYLLDRQNNKKEIPCDEWVTIGE